MDETKPERIVGTSAVSEKTSVEVKEYTNSKGEKVSISTDYFTTEKLSQATPAFFEELTTLKEPHEVDACRTCRFWKATEFRSNIKGDPVAINGVCRFNIPEIAAWYAPAIFPVIGPYEWCGKFEAILDKPNPV